MSAKVGLVHLRRVGILESERADMVVEQFAFDGGHSELLELLAARQLFLGRRGDTVLVGLHATH